MSDITEFEETEELTDVEVIMSRLDEIDRKLDRLVLFCDRAAMTAEKLSTHPMMASFFPGGVKKVT